MEVTFWKAQRGEGGKSGRIRSNIQEWLKFIVNGIRMDTVNIVWTCRNMDIQVTRVPRRVLSLNSVTTDGVR